jgi:hypothetical protein
MAMVLVIIGYIVMAVGGIWILILAFQDSAMWGILCFCIPLASFVFVFTHFEDAKKPFFVWLAGLPIYLLGAVLMSK